MSKLSISGLLERLGGWVQRKRWDPSPSSDSSWQGLMIEGNKLRGQARFADAERAFNSAVRASEDFGRLAVSLNALATIVQMSGRYDEAESLFRRVIAILEQHPGYGRLDLAVGLGNMANLLRVKGQYSRAERLCLQALNIEQTALGQDNPIVASTLHVLAAIQASLGRHTEAESMLMDHFLNISSRYGPYNTV